MSRFCCFLFGVVLAASAFVMSCNREEESDVVYVEVGDLSSVIDDTATQISRAWLPAHTRLSLDYEPIDDFGMGLVSRLRGMGFAIEEGGAGQGRRLTYLAHIYDPQYMLVVVRVGREGLSSLYQRQIDGNGLPVYTRIGPWARKTAK